MSKLYSEMSNGEIDRLKEDLKNTASFALTIEACDWFFPNFQKIIIDVKESIGKDYKFKIIMNADDEVSTLRHLAIFLLWRYKSDKKNDMINFFVKNGEKFNNITRSYEKVSRFLILFIEKYNMEKNLSFVKIPEFAKKYSEEGYLWPFERGGFGKRGMPLIPLDKEVYYSLQKNFYEFIKESSLEKKNWKAIANTNEESLSLSALREICKYFLEEFQKIKTSSRYEFDERTLKILNYADVLTFIIFASAFFGIYNPGSGSKTLKERKQIITNDDRFVVLYERCCAYSLGLLQLIENTITYTYGGFLSIRSIIRDDKYLNDVLVSPIENEDGFIAISVCDVADLSCGRYLNMVEKFSENLKLRKNEPSVKQLLDSKEIDNVNIKDLFFPANNAPLLKYLREPENTGYHYGLQIFASSVESANGNFVVISGNNLKFEYAALYDNSENKNIKNRYKGSDPNKYIYYCGTKYDILLPVSGILNDAGKKDTFPVPNELSYEALPDSSPFIVQLDSEKYINIILENKEKLSFEFKPKIVNRLAEDIFRESKKHDLLYELEPLVICLETHYRASAVLNLFLEIIAKATFILLSNDKFKYRNIVLRGFGSRMHIAAFIRYYAQFYDRFGYNGSFATKSQIMLITDDESNSESVVLSGRYIGRPMYEYRVFSGGKSNEGRYLMLTLDSISARTVQKFDIIDNMNNPHCFDSIELKDNNCLTKRWVLDLKGALTTDFSDYIHIGSKIKNCVTHMHVSGVHIDSFYQIDQIFTNAYWAVKISQWLLKKISQRNADGRVVLYGYGHLMESVLHNVIKVNRTKFEYVIYDEGYHYTAEKVSQPNLSFSCPKQTVMEMIENDSTVVFVMPISTTLSSFKRMGDKLFSECHNKSDKDLKQNVEFIAVFQVVADNEESEKVSNLFFCDNKNGTVNSVKTIINEKFSDEHECSYLLSLPAKWQKPEECIFCYPADDQYERMLYTTDDTSLVPTMQLQDYKDNVRENNDLSGLIDFFERKNGKYIYSSALIYSHIERQDAHFAHYIQTRLLLNEIIANGSFEEQAKRIKNALFNDKKTRINIIVAPSHLSNQKFPVKINDSIFDGKAHIISVNAKKIYRSNFEAEYSNYSSLISRIINAANGLENEIISDYVKFYYVDDHINSGTTFFRMKSLMQSMLNCALETDLSFNFDAVITLVDRHSLSSVKDFINTPSHFYSFFKFNIPAVRSNGDSCPLCKRVFTDKVLELCAALDETANICAERRNAHNVKEISRYKSDLEKHDTSKAQDIENLSQRHMRRFEAENILWATVIKTEKVSYCSTDLEGHDFWGKIHNEIILTIFDKIKSLDSEKDRIEYLISFVKALARPFLSFRPFVATIAIDIIRGICDRLLQCDLSKKTARIVFDLKTISSSDKLTVSSKMEMPINVSKDTKLELINLLIVCLSGLSELNSTYVLDTNKIMGICRFYENASCSVDMYDPFPSTKESTNDKRSFADYVRFSIFRLVHHEKFGETRMKKFDECLENILKDIESADNNFEKLIVLIYLENETPCRKESSALEILHDEIISDVFDSNEIKSFDSEYEKILANSIAYIDENDVNENNKNGSEIDNTGKDETKKLILTPITTRGYCDAYNIGFDLHFLNKKNEHLPIDGGYNIRTKQLCGKISLSDEAVKSLRKFGISIFLKENAKNSYIFLKFSNRSTLSVWPLSGESDILTQMPPLYLRIKVESGTTYLDLLKTIRSIISQRNMILKKFAADLTTEDMNRLIAERRFNRALSITKASKHATEEAERTLKYQGVDEKVLLDRLVGQIRRLLANRTISTLYQVESIMFERENREVEIDRKVEFNKFYDDSDEIGGCTKLRLWAENDPDDKYTQIWNIMGKDDFFIYGVKDANTSHDVKLKFDIRSLVPSTYSYSLKYNALQEKKLMLDIIFLLANNAIRHLSEYYTGGELLFTIKQEGQFIVVSSPVGRINVEQAVIKTSRAMVIPPHVRKYFINKANEHDDENVSDTDGITLWTLARYFGRLEKHIAQDRNFSIIPISHTNNKYEVGFNFFSICFDETDEGYDFLVKMKCLEGRTDL